MRCSLYEVCNYGKDKIRSSELTRSNYISTENLLPKLAGYVDSNAMPVLSNIPRFSPGDVLVSNIRPYFQKMILAKEVGGCSNDVLVLRPNEEKIYPEFLYYSLARKEFFDYMTKTGKGTKMPRGDKAAIMKYEINLPSKFDQSRIAEILSSIDRKIANNNRTNDNLFKIAQSICDEWFVKYKFPGTIDELEDSEIGMIPSGWCVGNIDDKKLTKIAKSGVQAYSGTKEYVATADVTGRQIISSQPLSFVDRPSRANMQPNPSSVWFAKMENSVKNILVADYMTDRINDYIFSTGFMGLECLDKSVYYIWCYINSKAFEEVKNNLSTGTLMAGISNSTIRSAKYVIPPEAILKEFNSRVDGLFRTIYNNEQENIHLVTLRDTLLPQLLCGKIDLSKVEI